MNLGIPFELYYPAFAIWMLILTVIFIPRKEFKNLFWFGLIWGFLGSMTVGTIFSGLFKLFQWQYAKPFSFYSRPLWINLAWLLSIIVYLYYLPKRKEWYLFPLYLFTFALTSAAIDDAFHQLGLLIYIHWNPFYRFLVSVVWFYGATIHYKVLKANDPPESRLS